MSTIPQQIQALKNNISSLRALVNGSRDQGKFYAMAGDFCVFGCKITQGTANTHMYLALEGQAAGDSANLNPDIAINPIRHEEYPNIAFVYGELFEMSDVNASDTSSDALLLDDAPATAGYGRYDLVYVYVGQAGPAVAILTGTASAAVKTDFDANDLDMSSYPSTYDPTLPHGTFPLARVYVQVGDTGIGNARIADIRNFNGRIIAADTFPLASTLDEGGAIGNVDLAAIEQGGIMVYVTLADIKAYVGGITLPEVWAAGGTRWNGTDFIDENDDLIEPLPLEAATVAALPAAASAASAVYLVLDPGNNGTSGLPAACRSNGTKWAYVGGVNIIALDVQERFFTCPAATWDDTGSFSMATADAGASTKITSGGGVHGLTTALVITPGDHYINLVSGTGWTPGLYKITLVDSTTALTINHPYAGGLGQPVFTYAGGGFFVAKRWKIPPLSSTGYAELTLTTDHTHQTIGNNTEFNIEHVASSGVVGEGYTIYDQGPETTNAPIYRAEVGFANNRATNAQKTLHGKADTDGWGSLNTGIQETGAIETNVATDLIGTVSIAVAGDSVKIGVWKLGNAL